MSTAAPSSHEPAPYELHSPRPRRRVWLLVAALTVLPVLVCGGFCAGIFTLVFSIMKSSGAYTQSLAIVQEDPRVEAALGSEIEPGYLVWGRVNTSGSSGKADISYRVSGTSGSGTVHVDATLDQGEWTFNSIVVEVDATGNRLTVRPIQ